MEQQLAARVKVNEQGRIVIPAELRSAAGIHPGDTLILLLEGDHLEITTDEALLARIQQRWSALPAEVLLSDAILADRRAEVAAEQGAATPA